MPQAKPEPETLTASSLVALRLHNQKITQPDLKNPAQLLSWMGGIQGQDYGGAKWSMGLRLSGSTSADIEKAIAEGSIVRTWPMRGTLHFVAAADAHWLLQLTSPGNIAAMARRHSELKLDERSFAISADLFAKVLQGGQQLTRDELYALLQASGVDPAGQRGYHLLWRAACDGLICGGTPQGKQQTFALLDDILGQARRARPDHPEAELARRYFTSRGPATWKDYLWWSGLPAAAARAGFEAVKPELACSSLEGREYWRAKNLPAPGTTGSGTAYALPGFDEYLLGYQDRSLVLHPRHAAKVCPGGNGMFASTMVIGGRVAGTWRRSFQKTGVTVEPQAFSPLSKAQRAQFAGAAQRYAAFTGYSLAGAG